MPTVKIKMRVFVPKAVIDSQVARRNIHHTMISKTGPELRREFQKTIRTWKDKPNFQVEHYTGVRVIWVKVYTYSTVYRLLNVGSAPHPIYPRKAKMLRFQSGFRPKTRSRVIGSFAGGKFGAYKSIPFVEKHPGFEAREFDEEIAEEYADIFRNDIQNAINQALP